MVETMQKHFKLSQDIIDMIDHALSAYDTQYTEKAIAEGRRETDWSLCESGKLSEAQLLEVYLQTTGLRNLDEDDLPEPELIPDISLEYMNHCCCIPLEKDDQTLELLICDPYQAEQHIYFFKKFYNKDLDFILIARSTLERMLSQLSAGGQAQDMQSGDNEETLRNLAGEAKIVRLVNEMFSRAVEQRASDIHIEPDEKNLEIRFRVDGILHNYITCPLSQYPAIASRIKLIGGLNIAESRLPQDGRTNLKLSGREMDIRISTIPTILGESIVLRILRKDALKFDLQKIGMADDIQKKFEKLIHIPHGMILVVGPTGSGKTTTLYSVMSRLNDNKRKIITIEDPVEYKFAGMSQMQVNPKIGLTFAGGLRHIVRQDPDIILVGEIRDRETAAIAINAALTGHLVFSTLHTNDAAGAVSRLLDMGIENFLVASALYGVLSQRLVRTICKDCNGTGINVNMTGNKCRKCGGTGFHGRSGIFELLPVDDKIRSAILRNSSNAEIAEIAIANGMQSLFESGKRKVADGITTETEIFKSTIDI